MFTAMRRQDRQLGAADTEDILREGIYGVLSVQNNEAYPYGIPLNFVYTAGKVYIHTALEGQMVTYLGANRAVSFCVVSEAEPMPDQFSTIYKSAILFGRVSEVSGDEKLDALIKLIEKYACDDDYITRGKEYALKAENATRVFRIDAEHVTGKARK